MGVIEDYLAAVTGHDWDALGKLVRDDVVRTGPYHDRFEGRDAYVGFLSGLMPNLPGYAMDVSGVTYTDGGRRAFAELAETVEVNGAPLVTPEVLVFDIDADERIARIDIFIKQQPA
ncbi:MAG TPA: nuclear transport factor 2 family protein [Mycobacteriales bacterium]|nr:nuclear transport factor 2 family protein [Mycobacteriales bacterium]